MAALSPSLEVFKDYVQSFPKDPARAMMYNLNRFDREFPKQVDSQVSTMLTDFGINTAGKSQTEILKALDRILVKIRTIDFFDNYYLSFIAFVGKQAIQKFNG